MNDIEPHVVWWGLRKGALGIISYTKQHYTLDGEVTLCGRRILVGGNITFFPLTDDDPNQVTCKTCVARLLKSSAMMRNNDNDQ